MPFKVTRRKDGGGLCEYWGVVTPKENEDAHNEVVGEDLAKFKKIRYLIIDHTKTEHFNHSPEGIQKRAALAGKRLEQNPDLLLAIVAPNDLFYGVARMWRAQAGKDDRIMLFRNLDEAEIWVHQKSGR